MIYTKKHNRISSRATAVILTVIMLLLIVAVALADYVGTGTIQISLDPASVPTVAAGLGNGDQVSYILQQAPRETGGAVSGMNAYGTVYVPDGVRVVNTEFVQLSGGQYVKIAAKDVAPGQDGCGSRDCRYPSGIGNVAPNGGDGKINEVQQDSGIFYSTDSRTALAADHVNGVGTVDPTGVGDDQKVFNQWDYDQVKAFGEKPALSGNDGKGNTPVFPFGTAGAIIGTGAPVAGPHSWYTNDYNPACDGNLGTNPTAFEMDVQCVGPWNRIKYDNGKIGGDRVGGATITADAVQGNTLANTAVLAVGADAGLDYATATNNALPNATNAVRYVFGAREVGDIELARITFEIIDIDAYNESVLVDKDFCMDGTGGDHNKPTSGDPFDPRGPQDNNWRYYESNNHTCYDGQGNAGIVKDPTDVNGNPISGNEVNIGDVISYEMTFFNTTSSALENVMITDTAGDKIHLIEPGINNECAYSSYDGDQPLNTPPYTTSSITGSSGATATWDTLLSLPANSQVTVHVCGIVQTSLEGDEVLNNVCAVYDIPNGDQDVEVCDNTILLVSIDPVAVTLDSLSANGSDLTLLFISMSFALLLTAAVVIASRRRSFVPTK